MRNLGRISLTNLLKLRGNWPVTLGDVYAHVYTSINGSLFRIKKAATVFLKLLPVKSKTWLCFRVGTVSSLLSRGIQCLLGRSECSWNSTSARLSLALLTGCILGQMTSTSFCLGEKTLHFWDADIYFGCFENQLDKSAVWRAHILCPELSCSYVCGPAVDFAEALNYLLTGWGLHRQRHDI